MGMIDMRVRPPLGAYLSMALYKEDERRDRITRIHGFEPAASVRLRSMDLFMKEMNEAGVTIAALIGRNSGRLGSISNDAVQEISRAYPGRFICVASIDPTHRKAAMAEICRVKSAGFRAINIEPGSYPLPLLVDDRRLYPIYGQCEDLQFPVIIMSGGSAGPDLQFTSPIHLDRVAADFPSLKIVVSHGGWPWVSEYLHIAFRRSNVYLSPDQYLANMPGMDDYIKAANGFLTDRFLYGSSYPFTPILEYAKWFKSLPIAQTAIEKIVYGNAAKLFGIGADPAD
jgi:predicted TIM-barrel fold metal-dependent hydrolase